MEGCPYCEIVTDESDAHILADTNSTVAFLDRNPATPGHTLVVPRRHCEFLFKGENPPSRSVFETVERLVEAMNSTLTPDGVSTFYTSGPLVGNVSHAHVHVIPRYEDDSIHLSLTRDRLEDDEGAELARRIRKSL